MATKTEPVPTNPRLAALASIAASVDSERASELSDFNEDTGEVMPRPAVAAPAAPIPPAPAPTQTTAAAPPPDEDRDSDDEDAAAVAAAAATLEGTRGAASAPAAPAAAPGAPAAAPAAAPASGGAPATVMLLVDGQQIEVPMEKVIEEGRRTLQKQTAADRRLAQAQQVLRQAQQEAQGILNSARAHDPQAPSSQDVPPNVATATPALSPVALASWLHQELDARDAQRAANQFRAEFPDIANDPYLYEVVASMEDQRIAEANALGNPLGDPIEAYRRHGQAARAWLQSKGGQPAQTATAPAPAPAPVAQPSGTSSQDRLGRKRSIVAVPGVNAVATPGAEKPKTTQQVIAEMANRRRAQPVPARTLN